MVGALPHGIPRERGGFTATRAFQNHLGEPERKRRPAGSKGGERKGGASFRCKEKEETSCTTTRRRIIGGPAHRLAGPTTTPDSYSSSCSSGLVPAAAVNQGGGAPSPVLLQLPVRAPIQQDPTGPSFLRRQGRSWRGTSRGGAPRLVGEEHVEHNKKELPPPLPALSLMRPAVRRECRATPP
ncbi:unnamed protein product [Urochloa humidicola]